MLATQERIETHNGITIYQMENGEPVSAVFESPEWGRRVTKNKEEALDWWDTDKWFRPKRRQSV